MSQKACIPTKEKFIFLGGDIFDSQISKLQIKAIMRTTTVKKKLSRIDGVSRFFGWERAVRLIKYMRGTFMKNRLKTFTTTVAEMRETEKLIFKE